MIYVRCSNEGWESHFLIRCVYGTIFMEGGSKRLTNMSSFEFSEVLVINPVFLLHTLLAVIIETTYK